MRMTVTANPPATLVLPASIAKFTKILKQNEKEGDAKMDDIVLGLLREDPPNGNLDLFNSFVKYAKAEVKTCGVAFILHRRSGMDFVCKDLLILREQRQFIRSFYVNFGLGIYEDDQLRIIFHPLVSDILKLFRQWAVVTDNDLSHEEAQRIARLFNQRVEKPPIKSLSTNNQIQRRRSTRTRQPTARYSVGESLTAPLKRKFSAGDNISASNKRPRVGSGVVTSQSISVTQRAPTSSVKAKSTKRAGKENDALSKSKDGVLAKMFGKRRRE